MAITTIAHGEKVYTGNDLRAFNIARSIGQKRYNKVLADTSGDEAAASAARASAQNAAMGHWMKAQQIMSATIKSDLHSFPIIDSHISSTRKYTPYAGPLWDMATTQADLEERRAKLRDSRPLSGPGLADLIARRKATQLQGERIATERDEEAELGKFRSMMRIAEMKRESAGRFGPRGRDAQTQKQIKTIEKGVQKAFGGKSLGMLRDVFGYGFGYGHIARAAISTAAAHSHGAQATFLSGLGAGVDMKTMRGLENAAEMLGGSKGDAAQFAKNITHFLHSSQMGLGWGPFESFYKYGIKLHSGMSRKEIMWNIAEGYSNLDQGRKGSFAGEGVVPAAFLGAMGEGGDKFLEALEKGAEYIPENLSELRENSLALRELGVSWNRFVDTSIPLFTDAVNAATGALNAITKGSEFLNDVRKFFKGENNGQYNVVQDYFNNIASAQKTASSYGIGNVLAGALVPSGVGMMAPNPNFGSTTNIVVNAPGLTQAEAQEIADAAGKISRKSSIENINYVIYASENL